MKKNVMDMIMIMVVVFFVGLFGFMAGTTADEFLEGKETTQTEVVNEIDNAFWITDEVLKIMR